MSKEQLRAALAAAFRRIAQLETDRKVSSQEGPTDSELQYRAFFEQSPDAQAVVDLRGNIIYGNRKMAEIHEYDKPQDIVGKNVSELVLPASRKRTGLDLQLAFREGMRDMEVQLLTRNGTTFDAEISGAPIRSDRTGTVMIVTVRDISERKQNERDLRQAIINLRGAAGEVAQTMAMTVESRDPCTAGHQRRTADLSCAIAYELGLPETQVEGIRLAATIHDLGKIIIPAEILSKQSRLSELEMQIIRTHSQAGYEILKNAHFPWPLAGIVLQHHERIDGSGYPFGLTGEEMLMDSKIIGVADVVEAMASNRPYRPARNIHAGLEEIAAQKGTLYEPEVVNACLGLFLEKRFGFEIGKSE